KASGVEKSYTAKGLLSARIKKPTESGRSSLGVEGYPLNSDEIGRLVRIIRKKVLQLPRESLGLLIVVDSELHPRPVERPRYSPLVKALEEYVFGQPQLAGLLMILPFGDPSARPFSTRGDSWVAWRKVGPAFLVEDRILVLNPYASSSLDERVTAAVGLPSGSTKDLRVRGSAARQK